MKEECCISREESKHSSFNEELKDGSQTVKHQKANYLLLALVVGLLIFSGVQTFQINGLEDQVVGGTGAAVAARSSGSSPAAAASTRSAPAMVGGC